MGRTRIRQTILVLLFFVVLAFFAVVMNRTTQGKYGESSLIEGVEEEVEQNLTK